MKKVLMVIIVLLLLGGVGYLIKEDIKNGAVKAGDQFMRLATAGDPKAAEYLAGRDVREGLLQALAERGLFLYQGIEGVSIRSLNEVLVTFKIKVKGQEHLLSAAVTRESGSSGWRIAAFPHLKVLTAVYVQRAEDDITVFLEGNGGTYEVKRKIDKINAGDVVNAVILEDKVIYVNKLEQREISRMLVLTPDRIEGEQEGFLNLAENVIFFKRGTSGNVDETGTFKEMVVGMKNVPVFIEQNQIKAVILSPEDFSPNTIRVALNVSDFKGTVHQSVQLSGTASITISDKVSGESFQIAGGRPVLAVNSAGEVLLTLPGGETRKFPNRIFFETTGSGRIVLESIYRGSPPFTPHYRGHLEIAPVDDGLVVVNEVSLEDYLLTVVRSEMPVSFGLEPLKAQAVAARSYAVLSIYRSGYRHLAAHVDDGTMSQVYNNLPEHEVSTRAVRETAGLIAVFNGRIADTRFFSTSPGITANFSEVWHDTETGAFPGRPVPYLVSRPQLRSGKVPDVSSEDGAKQFFSRTGWDAYDLASPWFRWELEMTRLELETSISANLAEQQKTQPGFVLTLDERGEFKDLEIPDNPVGKLLDLRVTRRGQGGNIMELEVVGQNGTYRLIKELTIRFVLRPVKGLGGRDIVIRRHDGSTVDNYPILPSTFLTFELSRNEAGDIEKIVFRGGGNGHCCGMSQWGARGMARDGQTFREIIGHYYPGVDIISVY